VLGIAAVPEGGGVGIVHNTFHGKILGRPATILFHPYQSSVCQGNQNLSAVFGILASVLTAGVAGSPFLGYKAAMNPLELSRA
jgi:hypothetical protein